jgi:outer membrane lipoprotein LolB
MQHACHHAAMAGDHDPSSLLCADSLFQCYPPARSSPKARPDPLNADPCTTRLITMPMPRIFPLPYPHRAAFRHGGIAAALAAALAIGGCASTSMPPRDAAATTMHAARPYHETLSMAGRLSVRYEQNGRNEAVHGSFIWQQEPDQTRIELRSPTGQTIALIDVTPFASTLTQSNQPPRQAANVDALAADALGWPLPVSGLRNWLQGFGIDQHGQEFVATPAGQRTFITRDGWQIIYENWQQPDGGTSAPRPRRIDLQRMTEQAGPVEMRIVIDEWQAL